jgi:hypothetical protein
MIIVKLTGGLGNQMFQYATARRLAHVNGTQVKLDLSWFSNIENIETSRRYELHLFNIVEEFALPDEVASLKKTKKSILTLFRRSNWIHEKHYHFNPDILKLPDNVCLEGYWQSERYFKDIENIIRKEFTFKVEPDELNRRFTEAIKNSESVSIHVRRGDYVSDPATYNYHGICPIDYYIRGVKEISTRVRNPHFFIFSDDPVWVKENLKLTHPMTFIDHNGPEKAYEDLRLLSLCKNHIIANSSFSWWGAWLSENSRKTVVAPKKWFNDSAIDTSDLLPDSWIRT